VIDEAQSEWFLSCSDQCSCTESGIAGAEGTENEPEVGVCVEVIISENLVVKDE
jgi:hypothetical protein